MRPGYPLLALLAWLAFVPPAVGAEVGLRLTTIGQGYQTRTVDGELLDRRRVAQWVDLWAARLLGVEGLGCRLSFRVSTELGIGDVLADHLGNQAELMIAQLAWRPSGWLTLVAGRQMHLDELDLVFFDGLQARLSLPAGFALRIVTGLRVRDRSWMGGEVLELSGVDGGEVPAPVVGASLLFGIRDVHAGIDYRRTVLWEAGWPLEEELIGMSASARLWKRQIGLEGGAAYDLLQDDWDRVRADIWWRLPGPLSRLRLEAGYLQSRPRYALDSIFHFFSPAPFHEIHAGTRWRQARRWTLLLQYTYRQYRQPELGEGDGAGWRVHGVDLDGRLRLGRRGTLSFFGGFEDGVSGRRWLLAPRVSWELGERAWIVEGRGIVSAFDDPVQDNQHAVTVGASAAVTWRFGERYALVVLAELNGNRFHPVQLRTSVVLDLAFQFGPGGHFP